MMKMSSKIPRIPPNTDARATGTVSDFDEDAPAAVALKR